jgi:membrane-associated phospholipid phosphatase
MRPVTDAADLEPSAGSLQPDRKILRASTPDLSFLTSVFRFLASVLRFLASVSRFLDSTSRLLAAALDDFGAAWRVQRYPSSGRMRKREAAIALFLCVAVVDIGHGADAAVASWTLAFPETVRRVFEYVTLLGTSGYIFAISAAVATVALLARERRSGRSFVAAMNGLAGRATFILMVNAVGGILAQLLKHLAGRARPKLMSIVGPFHFDLFSIKASLASFPSGHTITAFATAMALSYFAPRLRIPLFVVASIIAASRLAIGAHYLSDVLAGIVLGVGTSIYTRRAFATRGLVFRRVGDRIRVRSAGSLAVALTTLADRASR